MCNHTHCIDVNQIMSDVHKLKSGKSVCIDNLYSEKIVYICYIISFLFYLLIC